MFTSIPPCFSNKYVRTLCSGSLTGGQRVKAVLSLPAGFNKNMATVQWQKAKGLAKHLDEERQGEGSYMIQLESNPPHLHPSGEKPLKPPQAERNWENFPVILFLYSKA